MWVSWLVYLYEDFLLASVNDRMHLHVIVSRAICEDDDNHSFFLKLVLCFVFCIDSFITHSTKRKQTIFKSPLWL